MINDADSISLVHPHCDLDHTEKAKGIKYLYASVVRHLDVCSMVRYYNGQTSFKTRERS